MSRPRRHGVLSLRVLVVFVILATAQTVSAQAIPAHPRQLSFEPLEFEPPAAERHRHTLSNGVLVFVVEDHTLPLVSVSVTVRREAISTPMRSRAWRVSRAVRCGLVARRRCRLLTLTRSGVSGRGDR